MNFWSRFIGTAAGAALLAIAGTAKAGELTIRLDGVQGTDGKLMIALYKGADGFLKQDKAIAATILSASTGARAITVHDLPAGDYAAAVFHDADGDGKMNTNLIGIPTEGFGFSNNARGTMGPPKFDPAAISVPATGQASTAISLVY